MNSWHNCESLMICIVVNELNNMWCFIHLCFLLHSQCCTVVSFDQNKERTESDDSCHKTGAISAALITPVMLLVLEAFFGPVIV